MLRETIALRMVGPKKIKFRNPRCPRESCSSAAGVNFAVLPSHASDANVTASVETSRAEREPGRVAIKTIAGFDLNLSCALRPATHSARSHCSPKKTLEPIREQEEEKT